MRVPISILVMAIIAAPSARAADLTKIDRTITKEPVYQTKTPKYCLLVFGPEAKLRVWLVQDGDTLYVDRNGNGDLTEDGEKVAAKKGFFIPDEEGVLSFDAGDIHDGARLHRRLSVNVIKLDRPDADEEIKEHLAKRPQAQFYLLAVAMDIPGFKGAEVGGRVRQTAGKDMNGLLLCSDKPQDAPIVHLGGPWQITLDSRTKLTAGRETEMTLVFGTPGIGPGTTTAVAYEGVVPEGVYPQVAILYPPQPNGTPLREKYELRQRC